MAEQERRHADIIVVGAGILGTFHAYFAAQKGLDVLLLERHAFPTEASTRNFGMIVQTIVPLDSPWASYALKTRETYQQLQLQHDITVRQRGSLYLATSERERVVLEEFAQRFSQETMCRYLVPQEVAGRYQFVRQENCSGALLFPHDLMVEPRLLLRQLLPYLAETTAITYRPHTTVVEVSASAAGCRVKAASGQIFTAGHVVICSGSEYRLLFPEHFLKSGMQVCKLQMMRTVPQSAEILPHNILSRYSIRRYPAFQACPGYHLLEPVSEDVQRYGLHPLLKQAADGSVIIGDSHEYKDLREISAASEYTNPQITQLLLQYARQLVTLPAWEIQSMWNGYYLTHQDPVFTEDIDHYIHIATGIAGKGMSTGPGFAWANVEALFSGERV